MQMESDEANESPRRQILSPLLNRERDLNFSEDAKKKKTQRENKMDGIWKEGY